MFKKLKQPTIFLIIATLLPFQLAIAENNKNDTSSGQFYIGTTANIGYVPSNDFKITQPSGVQGTADLITTIKNKAMYTFGGCAHLGYIIGGFLMFEVEGGIALSPNLESKDPINTSTNSTEIGKTNIFFGMASSYFNINLNSAFMPYIGVGGGLGHYIYSPVSTPTQQNLDSPSFTKNTTILQGSFGVNKKIYDIIMFGTGYKFLGSVGEIELEQNIDNSATGLPKPKIKHQFMRHLVTFNVRLVL